MHQCHYSVSAFSALQTKLPHVPITLLPSTVTLSRIEDVNLTVLGTLTLPVTLAPNVEAFIDSFRVIK